MPTHARQLGQRGEAIAQDFYRSGGYEVVASNVYYRGGEIDLIVRPTEGPPGAVVFVEVKTRSSTAFGTAEAVTTQKLRRMRHAAARWLDEQQRGKRPLFLGPVRFDVLVVRADADSAQGAALEIFEGVEHGAC
ncbi:YraN family protein [Corynebacterium sp. MSK297]|uniref:YraN family protein n=1 Tax=Corynebacterium sp. MSK297 TaxID=3050221 RepID=UPI0025509CA3|nr:YraN family protein [Corynebacterium sp. MSK297]MDK8845111.1 YraN family protein [Corynebacterium sp. MSK297]